MLMDDILVHRLGDGDTGMSVQVDTKVSSTNTEPSRRLLARKGGGPFCRQLILLSPDRVHPWGLERDGSWEIGLQYGPVSL